MCVPSGDQKFCTLAVFKTTWTLGPNTGNVSCKETSVQMKSVGIGTGPVLCVSEQSPTVETHAETLRRCGLFECLFHLLSPLGLKLQSILQFPLRLLFLLQTLMNSGWGREERSLNKHSNVKHFSRSAWCLKTQGDASADSRSHIRDLKVLISTSKTKTYGALRATAFKKDM